MRNDAPVRRIHRLRLILAASALAVACLWAWSRFSDRHAVPAAVEGARLFTFDIPPQPLARALAAHSAVTGVEILYTQEEPLTASSRGVQGALTAHAALDELLRGTGLEGKWLSGGRVTLRHHGAPDAAAPERREAKSQ